MRPALDPRKRVGFRVSAAEINDPLPRVTGADRTRLTAFPGQKRRHPKREGALIFDNDYQPSARTTIPTTGPILGRKSSWSARRSFEERPPWERSRFQWSFASTRAVRLSVTIGVSIFVREFRRSSTAPDSRTPTQSIEWKDRLHWRVDLQRSEPNRAGSVH